MKIQTILLGKIGDMICLTSIFPLIKQLYPDAEINVIASRLNEIVIRQNPYVNKIIVYRKEPLNLIKSFLAVRKNKYDFHINPKDHFSNESNLFARLSRAKTKIGFNKPDNSKHKVFDISLPSSEANFNLHFNERIFNAFSHIGLSPYSNIPKPEYYPSIESLNKADIFIQNHFPFEKMILLNISASNNRRMWQNEKWEKLIKSTDLKNRKIAICFAPEHKSIAEDLIARVPNLVLFHSNSVDEVFALIKSASLLITNDTAVIHAASAFNTPLFGIFNGLTWSFNKFSPLSDIKEIVKAPDGEEYTDIIDTNTVIEAYERLKDRLIL